MIPRRALIVLLIERIVGKSHNFGKIVVNSICYTLGAIALLFTVASHARADSCVLPMTTMLACSPSVPDCNKCTPDPNVYQCTRDDGTTYTKPAAKVKDNNPFSGARSINVEMHRVPSGTASWYGSESGNRTASGAHFNPQGDTCAMRTHNWRWVVVTVTATGKSARCYVNDYGPSKRTGRLIDVSHGMAKRLGFVAAGVAQVTVE